MARPSPYSHALLATALVIIAAGFLRQGHGRLVDHVLHDALGFVGVLIVVYVVYWDPPPLELRSRRLLLIVAAILGSMMIGT